jgi:hypothetical protein
MFEYFINVFDGTSILLCKQLSNVKVLISKTVCGLKCDLSSIKCLNYITQSQIKTFETSWKVAFLPIA